MSMNAKSVFSFTLDHVELFVPDRTRAAAWYAEVLGCQQGDGRWRRWLTV